MVLKSARETLCARVPYLDLLWRGPSIQLHGDLVLRSMLEALAETANITSVIETGTYRGDSTLLFSKLFPRADVYTLDINPIYSYYTKTRLRTVPNVQCLLGDSKYLIPGLIASGSLGRRPLFWLDAHWGDAWPLESEVRSISRQLTEAVIMIDDFRVPGEPQFDYDLGSGRYDRRPCDFDLIRNELDPHQHYDVLYPRYGADVALDASVPNRGSLHGYVAIFQNLGDVFQDFYARPLIRSRFTAAET